MQWLAFKNCIAKNFLKVDVLETAPFDFSSIIKHMPAYFRTTNQMPANMKFTFNKAGRSSRNA